jgi:hypothetical protein
MKSKKFSLTLGMSVILLLVMATTAGAGTINVCTNASWTNSTSSPTQIVPPNPGWAAPFSCPGSTGWISYEQSGDPGSAGFVSPPNGTIVDYFDVFTLPSTPTSALLDFGADDTGQVWINGVKVIDFATGVGNTYSHCSDFSPGCNGATEVLNMNVASFLTSGANTIQLVDAQINASSFGVDMSLSANVSNTTISETPEAPTLVLMGSSLGLLGFVKFKPKRQQP